MTAQDDEIPGEPSEGEVLAGKYRILRLIGRGGMGAVYLAHHELLQQEVAIKVLLPEIAASPEAVGRFLNEARAAARIRSEHVAAVMDVGLMDSGGAYMVLELLKGCDLEELVEREGPLDPRRAVDYVLEALEAVAQAHQLGIVHRDLKPANLFLAEKEDGSRVVKVLDFGISKVTDASWGGGSVTSTRNLMGSPHYMSPEQLRSSKHVDARADIWSLGVILYHLVTGRVAFDGDSVGAVFAAVLEDVPAPPSSIAPAVPPELDRVILRCLERDRERRFPSVAELARALAPLASDHGRASAARIAPAISRSRVDRSEKETVVTEAGTAATERPPAGATPPAHTAAPWSQSDPGTPKQATRRSPGILAAAAVAVGVAGLALAMVVKGTGEALPPGPADETPAASAAASLEPVVETAAVETEAADPVPAPAAPDAGQPAADDSTEADKPPEPPAPSVTAVAAPPPSAVPPPAPPRPAQPKPAARPARTSAKSKPKTKAAPAIDTDVLLNRK